MQRISDAEMELMQVIWNNENPLTSREVMELLPNNQWKPTTILTMLSRLMEKGFLQLSGFRKRISEGLQQGFFEKILQRFREKFFYGIVR